MMHRALFRLSLIFYFTDERNKQVYDQIMNGFFAYMLYVTYMKKYSTCMECHIFCFLVAIYLGTLKGLTQFRGGYRLSAKQRPKNWGSAEGARIEAPRGWGVGYPPQLVRGLGGAVPLAEKFLIAKLACCGEF
jgi:hypothetical protein